MVKRTMVPNSPLVLKPHGPMGAMPHVSHGVSLSWSKGALKRLLGGFGRHWMGKVAKGSQRELSVCEGGRESVRESVNFKFIELLTQLKITLHYIKYLPLS